MHRATYFAFLALALTGTHAGEARAGAVVTFVNQTDSAFSNGFRTGQLTFTWDTTTQKFLSGTFTRSAGDFMSGLYTLDPATQLWHQSMIFPDRQVILEASPTSLGSLSSRLSSISSFSVGQTVSYEARVVSPSNGVNEVWTTPGVVRVSGVEPSVQSVPEPATLTLLGASLACLAGYGWRRRGAGAPAR